MNAAKRLEIFRRLHEDNPEPKTELAYTTLRTADCRDSLGASNRCRRQQGHCPPVPRSQHTRGHSCPGVDGLSEYIKTIGLYNSKAKNVIETCRLLVEQHGGEVPETREALEALPGLAARPPTWCSTPPSAN
jgi:endonuclease-3